MSSASSETQEWTSPGPRLRPALISDSFLLSEVVSKGFKLLTNIQEYLISRLERGIYSQEFYDTPL